MSQILKQEHEKKQGNIDWVITLVPLGIILLLSVFLFSFPKQSARVTDVLRNLFVNQLGFCYILIGLFVVIASFGVAFSKYGKIKLGNLERPKYSNFRWGAMIFTSTMAADILYWSLIEWAYYYHSNPTGEAEYSIVQQQEWASTYPLFHWGPIPWAFYILPAAAYAYRFFVKKKSRQSLSQACEPILGNRVKGTFGKIIDVFAVVGLLAGTATTFSLATPLLTQALCTVLQIESSNLLTIGVLTLIAVIFSLAVIIGMKAISKLAVICVVVFAMLLSIFIIFGPKVYMIESGLNGIGNVIQNFFSYSTWTDPLRATGDGTSGFPQTWTIFYWAYWIAWFVATPFFIANISEGRTIRQMITGAFGFGIAGTYTSFIVFGNFGLYQQTSGAVDVAGMLDQGAAPAEAIVQVFAQLPVADLALIILVVAMIAFYASTFDAITMVISGFSTKKLAPGEEPSKKLRGFWAIIFLILPVALIWSESTLSMLQTLSIVAAFPLGVIMLLIIFSFFKELKHHSEMKSSDAAESLETEAINIGE